MSKLDLVLARIRKLPPERQEAVAVQIDFLLDDEANGSVLTDAQWAEVEAALQVNEPTRSHDEVFQSLRPARAAE